MSRVFVGVDGSAARQAALDWALRECIARGSQLATVRAWLAPAFGPCYPEGSELAEPRSEAASATQTYAEEQLKLARRPGVRC